MTRGKVILTPFPFTDLRGKKVRPSVIISSTARPGRDVIVAFISSVFDPSNLRSTDVLLKRSDPDFPLTDLRRSSVFKMDKIATISQNIILGELGEVSPTLQTRLDAKLKLTIEFI